MVGPRSALRSFGRLHGGSLWAFPDAEPWHLVVATVSNWGAYGLLAYLSGLAGFDLLPTAEESAAALQLLAGMGAIHGMTGRAEAMVDGFSPADEAAVLAELRAAMR